MARLRKLLESDIEEIAWWDLTATDLQYWAGISADVEELKLRHSSWLQEPFVSAFAIESGGHLVGYGELWEEEHEVEIARLLINPKYRRQGFGRFLINALLEDAKQITPNVWLRVHPDNHTALMLYSNTGFKLTDPTQQAEFNAGQPINYVWMRAE